MAICALSYIGVRSPDLSDWRDFATGQLGMQAIDSAGRHQAFRMDAQAQRFVVADEPGDTLAFLGWQVEPRASLAQLAKRVDNAGYAVTQGSRALADRRLVADLVYFDDPAGNRVELVVEPMQSDERFDPGRPISGFVTGPLGMGHAVLHVPDTTALVPFYRDLLDFAVSDYGLTPVPMYFFHVNGRHHSFAIIGSGKAGLHHFMVEYGNLDDVGQGYDLALGRDDAIAYTLGRHTNDYMTSFYAHTPSGFFIESGWGGRVIDPASWDAHETHCGPSFWGHDRPYLPEPQRQAFEDMRTAAAKQGLRAPPMAECPWLYDLIHRR
ncbi:MAG: VOC family protein [Pseudomonadota bacterium]